MNGDNWRDFFYIKNLQENNKMWDRLSSNRWAVYCVHTDRSINNTVYDYEYKARKAAKLITYNINKKMEKILLSNK